MGKGERTGDSGMTPLIQSTVRWVSAAGQDPTELQWFDATGCFADRQEVQQDPLHTMRPPFEKCMVCFEGKSTNYERMEMHMITVGTDPEEGIVLSVWRAPHGGKPIASPSLVYVVDGGLVKYGPVDEGETIDQSDAQMVLGFMSAWLGSLSRRVESYVPSVKPTFTNRRKIAQGKAPIYDWRTVVIEPAQAKREHQGGTHASPRQHDRRGHLRRLRSGKNVWVSPCKVGDASRGVVFHDYKLEAA